MFKEVKAESEARIKDPMFLWNVSNVGGSTPGAIEVPHRQKKVYAIAKFQEVLCLRCSLSVLFCLRCTLSPFKVIDFSSLIKDVWFWKLS